MRKSIFVLIILMAFTACKSDKKERSENSEQNKKETHVKEKEEEYPNFTIKLVAKVEKDDNFRVLYTEDPAEPFNGKKAVFKEVKGSIDFQTIEFVLKKPDIYPTRLRMHPGYNKDQKNVTVQSIEILHDGSQFKIPDSLINKYFHPNKYIEYHKETGEAIFIEGDGKHVPFFVSKKLLNEKLSDF